MHHEKVKRTSEIYMKATWAAAAEQPGTERKHFCEAMMQAKLVWASDAPDSFPQVLIEMLQDQVRNNFRNDETFLRYAKSEFLPEPDQTSAAASTSAPSQQQQPPQLEGKKDLWPQLRTMTMKKLRQRLVDLRPFEFVGLLL